MTAGIEGMSEGVSKGMVNEVIEAERSKEIATTNPDVTCGAFKRKCAGKLTCEKKHVHVTSQSWEKKTNILKKTKTTTGWYRMLQHMHSPEPA